MNTKLLIAAVAGAALTSVAVPARADSVELTGVLRDFKIDHPDMQYPYKSFGVRPGVVLSTLDEDGKPVLNTAANYHNAMISGPESFAQWFRNVPDVNIAMSHSIVLDNGQEGPGGVYTFAREKQLSGELQYFFPMDHLGWNDMQSVSTGNHNFYFTYEIHTQFTYTDPSERVDPLIFSFTGDDDIWVFINGKLAVDIGGVHGQAQRSVNLDSAAAALGLEPGGTYKLDFFFAERHTTESNFRIETTLQLEEVQPETISPMYD